MAKDHVRMANGVVLPPVLDQPPRRGQQGEPIDVEAFIPQRPVERLDIGIVGRLSRPGEVDPHAVMIRPQIDEPTGKFGAIVGKQIARGPALTHQTVASTEGMFPATTLPHPDSTEARRWGNEGVSTFRIRMST